MHLDAIVANWRSFQKLAPNSEIAGVVKADGYGLGAIAVAQALARAGCRTFFTATFGEAAEVRAALGAGPIIYVLNGPSSEDVNDFLAAELTPVLNSAEQIALWANRAPAALHYDTGMNRLGVSWRAALEPIVRALSDSKLDAAHVSLFMSHLACAGDPASARNGEQLERFRRALAFFPHAAKSIAATGGAQLGADYHQDLIRLGLGLYGAADRADGVPLQTAVTIEAPILQVRDLMPGDTVGYGADYIADRQLTVATCAIGYADGFLRSLAGRGYGVIGGKKRPLLGRVSMDLVVIDVTGCAQAQPGARVEFLGPNAPVDDVARCAGTIAYEVLTTLAGTVRRASQRA